MFKFRLTKSFLRQIQCLVKCNARSPTSRYQYLYIALSKRGENDFELNMTSFYHSLDRGLIFSLRLQGSKSLRMQPVWQPGAYTG